MRSADSAISRTLISGKAMQLQGASRGCSKPVPRQLRAVYNKNLYSPRLIFWPCCAWSHLRAMRGKCWGVCLTCRHLCALVIWYCCWWEAGNLSHWWACSPSMVPFQLAWCLSPPRSERDDSLRIQHSGPAQQATQCCSKKEQATPQLTLMPLSSSSSLTLLRCHQMPSTVPHLLAHTHRPFEMHVPFTRHHKLCTEVKWGWEHRTYANHVWTQAYTAPQI